MTRTWHRLLICLPAMSQLLACAQPADRPGDIVLGLIASFERNRPAVDGAVLAADEINAAHSNESYLPGTMLPTELAATTDMADAVAGVDCVVVAIPSKWIRNVLPDLREAIEPGVPIVSLVKGLEAGTNLRMTDVIADRVAEQTPAGV